MRRFPPAAPVALAGTATLTQTPAKPQPISVSFPARIAKTAPANANMSWKY